MRWYIVQAFSGYEKQVQRSLTDRINRSEFAEFFGDVLVPTEEVVEMKDGKKRKSERKFFGLCIDPDGNERQYLAHRKRLPTYYGFRWRYARNTSADYRSRS